MKASYETAAYSYDLPVDLIAQSPLPERRASRLLVVDRRSGAITDRAFGDLLTYLDAGDLLVVNTSKVMRARLHGRRASGAPAELLLLGPEPDGTWLALGHPGGKLKPGRTVEISAETTVEILEMLGGGVRRIRWHGPLSPWEVMERHGTVPLPPYIKRTPQAADVSRYQTVYAERIGSAAAPTAGLHFDDELLDTIRSQGVRIASIDLAVGLGTFKPVETEDLRAHHMHRERYEIPEETATLIASTRAAGGRCWAVGTTVVRCLESAAAGGSLRAGPGTTALFIHAPYDFRVVDRLITNFHLPRSTLLMLVAAFGGFDLVMRAYRHAVADRYRFFSYGDAMAIL